MEGEGGISYVATLDIGTSSVRCIIMNSLGNHVGSASKPIELLYSHPGFVEIDPDQLWETVVLVIKIAIKSARLTAQNITCLGISTQRNTIITWNKKTGKHFHNFITWKDLRADCIVRERNESYMTKTIRLSCKMLYYVSGSHRLLAASNLKAMNEQVVCRLEWVLRTMPEVRAAVRDGTAVYGMIDSWLLNRLTGGQLHVTDVSCASSSGFFDPFIMRYSDIILRLSKIPIEILPTVCDSVGDHFGSTSPDIFGYPIPIRCSIADQSASLFASCCFKEGDTKVTLGTGTFMNVNTGRYPYASNSGLHPLVAWRIKDDLVFMTEGNSPDTASLLQWLENIGMTMSVEKTADIASSVPNTDGVFFIPSFSGIKAPINDSLAAAGYIGIKPTTRKAHLVRAVLESIAFRVAQLFAILKKETSYKFLKIRIDGGVSANDFIAQMVADLTGLAVERADSVEMSARGAAYLAGIHSGIWKGKEEITKLRRVEKTFIKSVENIDKQSSLMSDWSRALTRFLAWYK